MNSPTEWTLDEKFKNAKDAGFEGVECWLSHEMEKEHTEALNRHGLRLTLGFHADEMAHVQDIVDQAKRLKADFIFCHPLHPLHPLHEAAKFLKEAKKYANDEGVTFLVETHRNNIPESLNQALQLIDLWPEARFTGDFSHFILVSEFYGWEHERAIERMMPVLERTSHLHGRISNGEQVQVDVGDGSGQTAQFFVDIWTATMRAWRKGAGPGDVFPFASELGPPRYAMTGPDGKEFSDRWAQSLVMKKLAEQAWAQSAS
jgi:sugar phosphate isomerase/epimerase